VRKHVEPPVWEIIPDFAVLRNGGDSHEARRRARPASTAGRGPRERPRPGDAPLADGLLLRAGKESHAFRFTSRLRLGFPEAPRSHQGVALVRHSGRCPLEFIHKALIEARRGRISRCRASSDTLVPPRSPARFDSHASVCLHGGDPHQVALPSTFFESRLRVLHPIVTLSPTSFGLPTARIEGYGLTIRQSELLPIIVRLRTIRILLLLV
jgi:hypothetical protein